MRMHDMLALELRMPNDHVRYGRRDLVVRIRVRPSKFLDKHWEVTKNPAVSVEKEQDRSPLLEATP